MNLNRTWMAACAAFLLFTGSAHAGTVNLFGNNDDLGLVSSGQTGTIDNLIVSHSGGSTEYLEGAAFGFLPPGDEITFTFTFENGFGSKGHLYADSTYKQTIGDLKYSAFSSTGGGSYSHVFNTHTHKTTNVPSPILATADMNHDHKHGTTTITNNSDVDVSFSSYFISYFQSICGRGWGKDDVIVHYTVSGDPLGVPLPDSLPMFGAGLAALIGYGLFARARRKNQSAP